MRRWGRFGHLYPWILTIFQPVHFFGLYSLQFTSSSMCSVCLQLRRHFLRADGGRPASRSVLTPSVLNEHRRVPYSLKKQVYLISLFQHIKIWERPPG
ncbi:hypothetical protein B0H63DRAFT_469031 [Podospora didyma]|uniref:Uncharacterized protein n=1 Tax=Podospora didyma TaxID=330526 RepID=A0AAE0NST1_9PEZI|nr:hypothetical protein B0H63DRAFT_469031 [Podospora didyma]